MYSWDLCKGKPTQEFRAGNQLIEENFPEIKGDVYLYIERYTMKLYSLNIS